MDTWEHLYTTPTSQGSYGEVSAADEVVAAPSDGPEKYTQMFCDAWKTHTLPPGELGFSYADPKFFPGPNPAGNLNPGLHICEELARNSDAIPGDMATVKFYDQTHAMLCPQISGNGRLSEGGQGG